MRIKQMPTELANKIAAGEVVERPASVVKELVENSIDANSTMIKIELEEAGISRIKITDNGEGMSALDSEAAFLPHATSKINNETDLFHVKTLGFRGEALASIAAVSKLTLKTSTGEEAGITLHLEGGQLMERMKSDARKGTEITVEELFFNTPARLKYMKSLHTELGHITDLLNRLALSYPEIRFDASHNGRNLFKTTGSGDLLQVISQIYGMSIAKKMVPVYHESLDYEITGYIARPEVTRASSNFISTMINGRYVKNYPLRKAIIDGYHTLLPIGKYPLVVLKIEMAPILVDVNVHPTKLEVRFSKDKALYQAVKETIRNTFRKETLIPEMEYKRPREKKITTQEQFSFPVQRTKEQNEIPETNQTTSYQSLNRTEPTDLEEESFSLLRESIRPKEEIMEENRDITWNTENQEVITERIPPIYPIGQLHGTYILGQNDGGFYMIDQHAAQERIKYEFYKDKLGNPVHQSQQLLLPLTFEFSNQEALLIEANQEELEKVGLYFEAFGGTSYIIRSHPNWFPKGLEEEIIRDIIDQIMKDAKVQLEKVREEAAIMMACKRSIKANHYLEQNDMFQLLEDLRKTEDPFTCPHGRPVIIRFSTQEIEKMFKRIM